jgi:hypothetical protein
MATGGWRLTTLLTPAARARLADEALRRHRAEGQSVCLERSPDEDIRRGNPARDLEWAPGGSRLDAFYHAPPLAALLLRLTGLDWEPSGERAAFSYYRHPGQYLDLHRDVDACDLAVITCIQECGAPARGLGGALCLWPSRSRERLAAIRARPELGRVPVRLRPGESIVLLGGTIPHRLEPVGPDHVRIVAPLCFAVRSGDETQLRNRQHGAPWLSQRIAGTISRASAS